MSYVNLNNPANFQLQEFEQLGFRYIVSGRPTISGETYRTIFVLTDAVVTATCPNGDSLSSETLVAGTVIHGFFEDVSVASGSLLAYKAGPITAQEIFDAYKAYVYAQGGIIEGESCAVADIAALLEDKLYSAASLVLIPSGYKVSHLYAERPLDSNGDFTFTRASSATRVAANGYIEKAKENLFIRSNTFNTGWSPKAGTFTQGVTDPFGGNTAWSWTATNTDPYLYQNPNITGVVTLSMWVKGVGSSIGKNFVLVGNGASPTIQTRTLTGDWVRYEAFFNLTTINILGFEIPNPAVTGDVVHIYGAQLNYGLVAQEYQETTTTSVVSGITNDMPRLDYSGGASCPSLLLEPSRTQLITQSEYLSGYTLTNSSIETNSATSPEGVSNATRFIEDTSTGEHRILNPTILTSSGTAYTYSFFVKANGRSKLRFYSFEFNNLTTIFDFVANNVISTSGGTSPNVTSESYGNDWYRVSISDTTTAVNLKVNTMLVKDDNSFNYTGDGTSGVLLYGFQLEAGSYATSYIPNHSGTGSVTRGAEINKNTFNSINSEGTIFGEIEVVDSNAFGTPMALSNGDVTTDFILVYKTDVNRLSARIRTGGTDQCLLDSSVLSEGFHKFALTYKSNDVEFFVDGASIGTAISVSIPTGLNSVRQIIGASINPFVGGTKQLMYFDSVLSDAECITLTTL
jgi:hypothetical protein